MTTNQKRIRIFITLLMLLVFYLLTCTYVIITPAKPFTPTPTRSNTENIKLVGYIAKSSQIDYRPDRHSAARGLEVANGYAYVAIPICVDATDDPHRYMCSENWLRVIDVSDPTKPTEVGVIASPINPILEIAISGNYAYIISGNILGLHVLDFSNQLAPTKIGSYKMLFQKGYIFRNVYHVRVDGDEVLVILTQCTADQDCIYEERVLDIASPNSLKEVRSYELNEHNSYIYYLNAQDIVISGDYKYIARGDEGLNIVNRSNPNKEISVGYYNTPTGVWGVAMGDKADDNFYITDYYGGIYVLHMINSD